MFDTETATLVIEDIRSHPCPLTDSQEAFVETCEDLIERVGELPTGKIATLYEILDDLDERNGATDDEGDDRHDGADRAWWQDEFADESDEDDDDDWDDTDVWR